MPLQPKFLIVDCDDDSRALLRWTVLRAYPRGVTREAVTMAGAVRGALEDKPDLIVVHRATDADAPACVRAIREVAAKLPIVVLSATDAQAPAARAAGATDFLKRDEWLRLRALLQEIFGAEPDLPPDPLAPAGPASA